MASHLAQRAHEHSSSIAGAPHHTEAPAGGPVPANVNGANDHTAPAATPPTAPAAAPATTAPPSEPKSTVATATPSTVAPPAGNSTKARPGTAAHPGINTSNFQFSEADPNLRPLTLNQHPGTTPQGAPLGPLGAFRGTFTGTGFNSIFRPRNSSTAPFPVPDDPSAPQDNVLELNLTGETLTFSPPLVSVPNRGAGRQPDIFLNGVPYLQVINDFTNINNGTSTPSNIGIHVEPGLWMHIPGTTVDPVISDSLSRMASIPHGTTINAQCLLPATITQGPPVIPPMSMTPGLIGGGPFRFPSQTASATNTARLPQDLTKFIAAGTITQAILDDPNTILRNAIKGQNITQTTTFTVTTKPSAPEIGGGVSNISFLEGTGGKQGGTNPNANADVPLMQATFWIERVQHAVDIPAHSPSAAPFTVQAKATQGGPQPPSLLVQPSAHGSAQAQTTTVTTTQIQYSQLVVLNFNGLAWPHISVATLVPADAQPVSL